MSYPNASPDRTSRRYHYAFAFTLNQDLKMAQPLSGMKPRPDQALSLNMKLLSHHELQGFGGIGEGMGMQLARDGRRILWLAHESAPKNFTAVDVTDPKNPRVVVQTELPHAKVRSNSLDVVGDTMAVAYQTSAVNAKPAGFDLFDISKPENPKVISHFDASGEYSRGVHAVWFVDGEYVHMASGALVAARHARGRLHAAACAPPEVRLGLSRAQHQRISPAARPRVRRLHLGRRGDPRHRRQIPAKAYLALALFAALHWVHAYGAAAF